LTTFKGPLQQNTESDRAIQSMATAASSNAIQAAALSANAVASPNQATRAKIKKTLHQL